MPFFRKSQSADLNIPKSATQESQRPSSDDYGSNRSATSSGHSHGPLTRDSQDCHDRRERDLAARLAVGKRPKLVFSTQLAHGSGIGKVEGFTSVRELYNKIAASHGIDRKDILYCTLNTAKVDMESLLGGQIGLEDTIYVHVKGNYKRISFLKASPAIGLTITDNGDGMAFIKKIKEGSLAHAAGSISPGDHIQRINGESMIGKRHYDVARCLKDLHIGLEFTLELIEPKRGLGAVAPRGSSGAGQSAKNVTSGKATLRLKAQGPPVVEHVIEENSWETVAIIKIDDILEEFMGIRDQQLADTIVMLGKDKTNPSEFATALDEDIYLKMFDFPDHIIFDMWAALGDAKSGRLKSNRNH
ncbi:uncharacterized protein TRIADDRAFT_28602 [Trichoplax adhaerens]|uniref:PDZ domain-containing protein n=1 Tax=Trichoplax adhaerens TaxID=10228 RepID=B3S3U7_TRIAD|nr:hypothetical protein TRIADDRAFT_28602 [Trichoplax adhaerens]EDV22527.1 hypothetical protein TRIADDRAFT_28602 [Trichoplax adhaerens]|eukprot:XP_002115071.1 hypothetical protein TRIADDRAFT_28602 [Trichoplax adhaerens]